MVSSEAGTALMVGKKLRHAKVVLAQGEDVLRPEHLPLEIAGERQEIESSDEIRPLKETMAEIECREIARALTAAAGNKSQVARVLKISYPNLLKKIRHYGIS